MHAFHSSHAPLSTITTPSRYITLADSPLRLVIKFLHHHNAVTDDGHVRPHDARRRLMLVGQVVELQVVLAELLDAIVHATCRGRRDNERLGEESTIKQRVLGLVWT